VTNEGLYRRFLFDKEAPAPAPAPPGAKIPGAGIPKASRKERKQHRSLLKWLERCHQRFADTMPPGFDSEAFRDILEAERLMGMFLERHKGKLFYD
jgi:hypothetical protein